MIVCTLTEHDTVSPIYERCSTR